MINSPYFFFFFFFFFFYFGNAEMPTIK